MNVGYRTQVQVVLQGGLGELKKLYVLFVTRHHVTHFEINLFIKLEWVPVPASTCTSKLILLKLKLKKELPPSPPFVLLTLTPTNTSTFPMQQRMHAGFAGVFRNLFPCVHQTECRGLLKRERESRMCVTREEENGVVTNIKDIGC
jgi:hypothetical protein